MTDPSDQEEAQQQGNGAEDGDADGGGAAAAAPQSLEQRVAALQAERDELKDRMLRIAAEFENWKKRSRKDQIEGEARVREAVLKEMLEVVDNLERATSAKLDAEALQKGVNLVLRLFQNKLERHDVRPFETKGQPFDPRLHEAISQVPSTDVPPGSVANELQKGYRIGDKLLRPAMVAVAAAPAADTTPNPNPQG
jgi:molecular chaperone GrpE